MRLAHVLQSFVSGVVVYVVMAACSSTSVRDTGGSSSTSAGGGSASSGSGGAIASPVPEAQAAETDTERCDKSYQSSGATIGYAEHAYPGVSAAELATSVSLITSVVPGSAPPGFDRQFALAGFVRDGVVGTSCFAGQTVTFVRR